MLRLDIPRMQFSTPLIKGTLIKRYKRFLADVKLDDGTIVTAHCPNTGAMTGCAEPGYTAWLSRSTNPKRKLGYTWELAQNFAEDWIGINTHNANKLVAEALDNKSIEYLSSYDSWKAEVTSPNGNARFDFCLYQDGVPRYLEVKSVTLLQDGQGYFPDTQTARGTKHCEELAQLATQGHDCTLLFCVQHTGIKSLRPAAHIDPKYAQALTKAISQGVKVCAVCCVITQQNITINQSLPVIL